MIAVNETWTPRALARYTLEPEERAVIVRAGLVPDFSADPPHVLQWRADLLRTCGPLVNGASVHRLTRAQPNSSKPLTVTAFWWPGDRRRFVVVAGRLPGWSMPLEGWTTSPLLAASGIDDPTVLDGATPLPDGPPFVVRYVPAMRNCAPPFVLLPEWCNSASADVCEPFSSGHKVST